MLIFVILLEILLVLLYVKYGYLYVWESIYLRALAEEIIKGFPFLLLACFSKPKFLYYCVGVFSFIIIENIFYTLGLLYFENIIEIVMLRSFSALIHLFLLYCAYIFYKRGFLLSLSLLLLSLLHASINFLLII